MIERIVNTNKKYAILKKLTGDPLVPLYAVERVSDGRQFLLRMFTRDLLVNRPDVVIRFRNETASATALGHPRIVPTVEIDEVSEGIIVVMDHAPAVTLDDILAGKQKTQWNSTQAINLMIQIADALDAAHRAHLVHKAIHPREIVVAAGDTMADNGTDLHCALGGFGNFYIMDYPLKKDDAGIAAYDNLYYIAPEHVRGVLDERSDLYCLGAVLYHLLCGRPPFNGESPNQLFHQHLAKIPESPSSMNAAIPRMLDAIILKLLAKNPIDRYQSARGLLNDLERFRGGDTDFVPGLDDRIAAPSFQTALIGREKEFDRLLSFHQGLAGGTGALCFISGDQGIGKTRIAKEFERHVVTNGGIFLAGSCRPGEAKVPYAPIIEALNQYIKHFYGYTGARKNQVRAALKKGAGDFGEILVTLNPALAELIEDYGPLVKIVPEREKGRFLLALTNFLYRLAIIEGGLVLLLEDLHWADTGTIEFLDDVRAGIAGCPLLVIATCRETEAGFGHTVHRIVRQGPRVNPAAWLRLCPLAKDDVRKFIAGIVHRHADNSAVTLLADTVYAKFGGTPLFCIETIKNLLAENMISCDEHNNLVVDARQLRDSVVSETVADILGKRLDRFARDELSVLSYAAVIGTSFDLSMLLSMYAHGDVAEPVDADEVLQVIDAAVSLKLLEESGSDKNRFSFIHESIHKLCYERIDPARRKALHLLIARAGEHLLATLPADSPAGAALVFDLANHYIAAGDSVHGYTCSLSAGRTSMALHAYEDAITYLSYALVFLEKNSAVPEAGSVAQSARTEITRLLAESYLVIGRYDESINLLQQALSGVDSVHERAYLYSRISEGYFKMGDWRTCERNARTCLELLGEKLPASRHQVLVSAGIEFLKHVLGRFLRTIKPPRGASVDDKRNTQVLYCYYSLFWVYLFNDAGKLVRTVLRLLRFAESRFGESAELGMGMSFYGVLLTNIGLYKRALVYHRKSIELKTRYHDQWGLAQSYLLLGYSNFFMGGLDDALENYSAGLRLFQEIGDAKEIENALIGKQWALTLIGETAARKECIDQLIEIAQRIRDDFAIAYAWCMQGMYYYDCGDDEKALEYLELSRDRAKANSIWSVFCWSIAEIGLVSGRDDPDRALACLYEARDVYESHRFMRGEQTYLYVEIAEAAINRQQAVTGMTDQERAAAMAEIRRLARTAYKKNAPLPINRGMGLRALARYYTLAGKNDKAEKIFVRSAALLKKLGYKKEYARTLTEQGYFLSRIGRFAEAQEVLVEAYGIYARLGHRRSLERLQSHLVIGNADMLSRQHQPFARLKDQTTHASVMALIKKMAETDRLEEIADRALAIIMEISGAEHGYIILTDENDDTTIIASNHVNRDEPYNPVPAVIRETVKKGAAVFLFFAPAADTSGPHAASSHYRVICLPIPCKDRVLGVCYIANEHAPLYFNDDDRETIEVLLRQIGLNIRMSSRAQDGKKISIVEPDAAFCTRYKITKREREIIIQLLHGYTRNEICQNLHITEGTVNTHITNVFIKTNVTSKTDLRNLISTMVS